MSQFILQPFFCFSYITGFSLTSPALLIVQALSLHLHHSSFSNPSVASPTSQLILQPFFRFSYVTGFSLTSPALLILQALRHFTDITAHSPTLPLLYLCHSSFSNPSIASPTSQLILQPFFCFSYVTGFSLTSPG